MNFTIASNLQVSGPEAVGMESKRWQQILDSATHLVESDLVPAISFQVQRGDWATEVAAFGRSSLTDPNSSITAATPFLIASLTKPMVSMAILMLMERGLVTLNQRISEIVPEFRGAGKRNVTIKNVLTHTSGLLDMLPNNRELRASNAPILDFVIHSGQADLAFPTGTSAQYQSMGFALFGPLVENLTGQTLREFIKTELFEPLGMQHTWLGLPESDPASAEILQSIAEVRVPADQQGEDHWNWNSLYWKTLGAPWGGITSITEDVSRFCRFILAEGKAPDGTRLLHPETIRLATSNRLDDYPDIPESIRRTRGWGLGFRMNWTDHRGAFCDLLDKHVCGHWGASGTLMWIDPHSKTAIVMLSTRPIDRGVSPLAKLSNQIVARMNP